MQALKKYTLIIGLILVSSNALFAQNRYYDFRERTPENKVHILYLGGGSWHDLLGVADILRRFLEIRHEYHTTYTEDLGVLARSLDVYDVILINGMPDKMSEAQLKGLEEAVKNGKPLLGLHAATAALQQDTEEDRNRYNTILGANFTSHPPIHTFPVKVAQADHAITKNIGNFEIYDEMYFYNTDIAGNNVLIEAEHEDKTTPIAWTRQYGKGKVFYTSLGHGVGAATNKHFQQLILNGLLWLLEEKENK
ncbi:ThuA domain-containing protein [Flagellimonas onchidii]|uniref:ThuA domain-containing protein n=1 Tax=Flagellimonas onchidii TaxID=2562684 RepID=UPI0010A69E3A|nr:ThuA domain-containing protein [Allomuricauda onchidii]